MTKKPPTARPKVVAGYLRLTVDRNGNKIGYDVQEERIKQWATAYGYEVVWFKDKDLTAADRKVVRPQYEEMLKRLASGEFAGIVVWRLDRLVRLNREFERCFGVVQDAKAFIQDVEQKINTDTSVGQLMMRLLVMMAEMEIAGMRGRAKAHHRYKAANGKVSPGGLRPFGFVGFEKDPETKVILNAIQALRDHHPDEAPLIKKAAHRIAYDGATYADIAKEWAESDPPVRGTNGQIMGPDRVREILTSVRMVGVREYEVFDENGDFVEVAEADADWKAIIDRDTWEVLRSRIQPYGPRTTNNEYLLTGGLAKCKTCGYPMIGGTQAGYRPGERQPIYKCNPSAKARKSGSCGGPVARADYTEATVLDRLFARLEETPALHGLVNAGTDSALVAERGEALRAMTKCDEALHDLGRRVVLDEDDPDFLLESEVRGRRAGLMERRRRAQKVLERIKLSSGVPMPDGDDQTDLRSWFDSLALGEKRSWLTAHLAEVTIAPRARAGKTFDPGRIEAFFADAKDAR